MNKDLEEMSTKTDISFGQPGNRITKALQEKGVVIFVYGNGVEDLPWSNLLHSNAHRIPIDIRKEDHLIDWSLIRSCINSPNGWNVVITSDEFPCLNVPEKDKNIVRLYPLVVNM